MRWKDLCLAAAIILITTACCPESTPAPPPCPIETLLLDKSVFPEGFTQGIPDKDNAPMRFGGQKIGVSFGTMTQGGASQDVYLGYSVNETRKKFDELVDTEYGPRIGFTEWYVPSEFNYVSSVADQYHFRCYTHVESRVERCLVIGRYGPYLVRFHVYMSSVLTYQDLELMLQTIDQQAARCLNK